MQCNKDCEVYSRIVGYFRPIQNWNPGKVQEFEDREEYKISKTKREVYTKQSINNEKQDNPSELLKVDGKIFKKC